MRRTIRTGSLYLLLLCVTILAAHGTGLSISYFLPRGGMFSHPVPPLSVHDLGLDFSRYLGTAASLGLYNIRGMGIKDADGSPIESGAPLIGPFVSVLGSVRAMVKIPIRRLKFEAGGGVFGYYNIDPPLMDGNLDRYLATSAPPTVYESVTSSVSAAGRWGWGWVFGGRAIYFVKGQIGISLGAKYYLGGSPLRLSGSYDAYDDDLLGYVTGADLPPELQSARLDYSGVEIILGVELEL